MFQLDARDIPQLVSYEAAHSYWETKKPWRDSSNQRRPLERHSNKKRHVWMERGYDTISCGLYSTTLVTYYASGNISVYVGHNSRSTKNFINAITVPYVDSAVANPVIWYGSRWPMKNGMLVRGDTAHFSSDWTLLNPEPILWPTLDRKKANALMRHFQFDKYQLWHKAYVAMGGEIPISRYSSLHRSDILCALMDRTQWVTLAKTTITPVIKDAIMRSDKSIIVVEERASFADDLEYKNWCALDRKYGWATI